MPTTTASPLRPNPLLPGLGVALLLLYAALLLGGAALQADWLPALNAHGHTELHAHGHPFADARAWLGIPNAADVLSNLPFALLALWGLGGAGRIGVKADEAVLRLGMKADEAVLRIGLGATALGSAAYHAWPRPETLVLDRAGMALAFAGLLALALRSRVGEREGRVLLGVLTPLAVLAAALPLAGNLMPWLLVQFGGVLALLVLATRPTRPGAPRLPLTGIVALYALAKVCEGQDAALFALSDGLLAGHTLKHLVAAGAAALAIRALNARRR
jgi:hypothetical protein